MDFIIVFGVILFVILSNLLFTHLIVRKALRKLIIPQLDKLGYTFIGLKKIGIFKTGDFKESTITVKPFNPHGNYKFSLYRYIDYQKNSKKNKRITVRIDWNLFRKTKIVFKPNL
ncbi:hypothetical protein E9993_17800 [Labilibacter sediminis]|nr:hypothetical protein E9993_17800 [Labilibacter sediminis]